MLLRISFVEVFRVALHPRWKCWQQKAFLLLDHAACQFQTPASQSYFCSLVQAVAKFLRSWHVSWHVSCVSSSACNTTSASPQAKPPKTLSETLRKHRAFQSLSRVQSKGRCLGHGRSARHKMTPLIRRRCMEPQNCWSLMQHLS